MIPAQPNQSLIDGLACLQALTSSPAAIGTRQLARQLGLESTRVNRLLKTLAFLGLAEQDEKRAYRPGPGIHVLAAQSLVGSPLMRHAIEPLEALHRHGHIVALGVLWKAQTCYLYHYNPLDRDRGSLGHERLYPAVSSGIGMVLLAGKTDDEVRALFTEDESGSDAADPSMTLVPQLEGRNGLIARLSRIRREGFALVSIPGGPLRTLAVPVNETSRAAIGFSGNFDDDQVDELVKALRSAADQISK